MKKNGEFGDRIQQILSHYGLNAAEAAKRMGCSKGTMYNMISGRKPDFTNIEALLDEFPDVSAEWVMRGVGPMMKGEIVSQKEVTEIRQHYEIMKGLYQESIVKANRLGKSRVVPQRPLGQYRREEATQVIRASRAKGTKGVRPTAAQIPASILTDLKVLTAQIRG